MLSSGRLRIIIVVLVVATSTAFAQINTGFALCYNSNDGGKTSSLNFSLSVVSSDNNSTIYSQILTLAPGACTSVSLTLSPQSSTTFYTLSTRIPSNFSDFTNYTYEIRLNAGLAFDSGSLATQGSTDFTNSFNPGFGTNSDVEFFAVSSATDKITITSSFSGEVGVLVNGQADVQWEHRAFKSSSSTIDLGTNLSDSTAPYGNGIISFATEHPPLLTEPVGWTAGADNISAELGLLFPVRLKIWIVYTNATDFAPAKQRERVREAVKKANDIMKQERGGLFFTASGADIQDVSQTNPLAPDFADFPFTCAKVCTCPKESLIKIKIGNVPGIINVYYVGTIGGIKSKVRGISCSIGNNFAVISKEGDDGTLIHEIGHDLSLEHVGKPLFVSGKWTQDCNALTAAGQFDQFNIMCTSSAGQLYLSEGQTFRMIYNSSSTLNKAYPSGYARLPAVLQRSPDCSSTEHRPRCPALDKRIWDDGALLAPPH